MELPDLPEDWEWLSLIKRGDLWLCFASDGDFWLQAGGSTPRNAVLNAIQRIENGAYHATLSYSAKKGPDLVKLLKINPPSSTLRRI
jgi:hypothetical protein